MSQRRRRAERPAAAAKNRADLERRRFGEALQNAAKQRRARQPGDPCPVCTLVGRECAWCQDDREDWDHLDALEEGL